jgi:hypothetical protein
MDIQIYKSQARISMVLWALKVLTVLEDLRLFMHRVLALLRIRGYIRFLE